MMRRRSSSVRRDSRSNASRAAATAWSTSREQAETALVAAAGGQPVPVGSRGRPAVAAGPQPGDHLFHNASHQCFINLHGKPFRRPAGGG